MLDAHGRLEGLTVDYAELDKRAIIPELGELVVRVVGHDNLIRIKRAAGCSQDLADIAALEHARRERGGDDRS